MLNPTAIAALLALGAILLFALVDRLLMRRRIARDYQDTEAFMLGADAWCQTHPDAWTPGPPTPPPCPGLTFGRRLQIEALARSSARQDFVDNGRRRANPYVRHSREFACWAIAYGEAWTGYEIAACATADPAPRTGPVAPGAEHA